MTTPQEDPSAVLGETARESAVERLREAYAEGGLSHGEMDERLGLVLTARTHGQLARALDALPPARPETASTIAAAAGRVRRRGAWVVPRHLKVESAFGTVRLDLSRAVIEHPVVDIELRLGTGGARIIVPRDAVVDVDGLVTGWKDLRYRAPRRTGPGGPRVRISGAVGFGRLKVRHARWR
ncbi:MULTISPECIES: DUF1707 domain-containing protein [unclassified Streptomyces]|uniref:DUF1707 SHOCT-like domain-containing protein n=1 Tax=unclassified Streptomyces TaxID=2593676 RepID=UPI00223722ED|nr:DUF1707 domain-containing protein [Streptomyces sp. SHP 1-2]